MGTITINDHLTETLLGKTRRAILSILYGHADEQFYLRQLVRLTGCGIGAVQRELKALAEAGIIIRTKQGKQVYYQVNDRSAVYPELKSLIMKTAGMGDALKTAILPLAERILTALVYGSVAHGNETKESDVDLFVVGDVTLAEIVNALAPVQLTLNREINPTVYPVDEFKAKRKGGHHFITSILKADKFFLIGDEHDLARLAS
jgi:predicted nucleotidyltransferase